MTIVSKMFAGGQDSSVPVPKCPRDISALVPNCLDTSAPVGWCRNYLGPKCPGSEVSWHPHRHWA